MASCQNNLLAASSVVRFDTLSLNDGKGFDGNNNFFTVPEDGIYWFHMSVGIPGLTLCDYKMTAGSLTLSVIRTAALYTDLDVTSRSDMLQLKKGQRLFISSTYSLFSDTLVQTSWSGFRLDSVMNPCIAFAVVSKTSTIMTGNQFVKLDSVFIDTHVAWNSSASYYTTPKTGLYFISFHCSANSVYNAVQTVYVYVNTAQVSNNYITLDPGSQSGSETISSSLLVVLYKGDKLQLYLNGNSFFSDSTLQTSLSGFLYQPSISGYKIAWSVANTDCTSGPRDPYPFPVIIINEGYGWRANQPMQNTFVATDDGVYHVFLSGGHNAGWKFNLQLFLNGQPIAGLQRSFIYSSTWRTNEISRSKAVLIRLNSDDVLRAVQPSGTFGACRVTLVGFKVFS